MFDSIGWSEVLVLGVAGLFILGPERLPAAAAWLGRSMRKVRQYATGAQETLRSELGPAFDELNKPLQDLNRLRHADPRRAVARHLFDDTDWSAPEATTPSTRDVPGTPQPPETDSPR